MDRTSPILPRLIRLRDAPGYLGMDRNKFNADVRPHLTEVPLGPQAIAFDRLELDAWVDEYIQCNGRRPKAEQLEDDLCRNQRKASATPCRGSARKAGSGISKNAASTRQRDGSAKARERLAELRRKTS